MNARLFCKTGQLAGAEYEIAGEATIGKSTGNSIQLYPTIISGNHARIVYDKNSYFLEDLKSRNGTRLDGVRVTGRERLDNLNVITFADKFDFIFQVLDGSESRPKPKAPAIPAAPVILKTAAVPAGPKAAAMPAQQTPPTRNTVLSDDFAPMPAMQAKPESAKQATPEPAKQATPEPAKQATPEPAQPAKPEPAKQAKTIIDDGFSPPLPPIDDKRAEQKPPAPPPPIDKNHTIIGDDFAPMPVLPGSSPSRGEASVPGPGPDSNQGPPVKAPIVSAAGPPAARPAVGPAAGPPSSPAAGPRPGPAAANTFLLEFKAIKSGPSSFTLKEGENIVGRETGCDIAIDDGSLSRRHAMLTVKDKTVKLKDLGSKNHTFAAGTKISSEIEIQPGMVLMFGVVTATLRKQ